MVKNDLEYWFMRWLISTDEFPGYGKSYTENLHQIANIIEESDHENIEASKNLVFEQMLEPVREGTKKHRQSKKLANRINSHIQSSKDLNALKFASESVADITYALDDVPSSDKKFAIQETEEYLTERGEDGLSEVLQFWDELGREGSMDAERKIVIRKTEELMERIEDRKAIRLSAFLQEFERRLVRGMRPQRAGSSLEDVTSAVLNHFDVPHTGVPAELETGFEVDNLIECQNGERIGISCKRTLRERWKQSSNLDDELLDKHGVREIWHLVTFDSDISSNMIQKLGEGRERIYLPDESESFKEFNSSEVSEYIRPLSQLIQDIEQEIKPREEN